jgi:ribosomal protein L29
MKKQAIKDIKTKDTKELLVMIKKSIGELVKLKMERGLAKNKNIHLVAHKNNEIAVLKTILREKTIVEESKVIEVPKKEKNEKI